MRVSAPRILTWAFYIAVFGLISLFRHHNFPIDYDANFSVEEQSPVTGSLDPKPNVTSQRDGKTAEYFNSAAFQLGPRGGDVNATSDRILQQLIFNTPQESPSSLRTIFLPGGLSLWAVPQEQSIFLSEECPVSNCRLTSRQGDYATADAVIHRGSVTRLPERPQGQLWIYYSLESPPNTPSYRNSRQDNTSTQGLHTRSEYRSTFNYTATYRPDSDIVTPYGKWLPFSRIPSEVVDQLRLKVATEAKKVNDKYAPFDESPPPDELTVPPVLHHRSQLPILFTSSSATPVVGSSAQTLPHPISAYQQLKSLSRTPMKVKSWKAVSPSPGRAHVKSAYQSHHQTVPSSAPTSPSSSATSLSSTTSSSSSSSSAAAASLPSKTAHSAVFPMLSSALGVPTSLNVSLLRSITNTTHRSTERDKEPHHQLHPRNRRAVSFDELQALSSSRTNHGSTALKKSQNVYREDGGSKIVHSDSQVDQDVTALRRVASTRQPVNVASKSRMIAWFVSNCFTDNNRRDYAEALARYVDVDVYGTCAGSFRNRAVKLDAGTYRTSDESKPGVATNMQKNAKGSDGASPVKESGITGSGGNVYSDNSIRDSLVTNHDAIRRALSGNSVSSQHPQTSETLRSPEGTEVRHNQRTPSKCLRNSAECAERLSREYRFYLAFENSNCRHYVTEKFFDVALKHNVIPIVMGPPKLDYVQVAPPNSFIHVDDFASPKHLATYIIYLTQNTTAYEEYFDWHSQGLWVDTRFWCRVCALVNKRPPNVVEDLEEWWRPPDVCRRDGWN